MRAIDADKLKEVLEKNFGHTGGASVLAQLIDAQDTIHPEPHWIPVAEGLPETDMYRTLTTIRTLHKGTNVRSGHYYKGFFCNDNGVTWDATDKEILAWMPLPEPYKEDSDE